MPTMEQLHVPTGESLYGIPSYHLHTVIPVYLEDLHTGARFVLAAVTERHENGTLIAGANAQLYEITCAAEDNPRGWVDVHRLDEGDDPLRVEDNVLATDGFFSYSTPTLAWYFVDPDFYTTPIVHGAQLALALQALSIGVAIDDDGSVHAWQIGDDRNSGGHWVDVPDYGVRALNYAQAHDLAVAGEDGWELTDAGRDLLAHFRIGYAAALQAGWTDIPVP